MNRFYPQTEPFVVYVAEEEEEEVEEDKEEEEEEVEETYPGIGVPEIQFLSWHRCLKCDRLRFLEELFELPWSRVFGQPFIGLWRRLPFSRRHRPT